MTLLYSSCTNTSFSWPLRSKSQINTVSRSLEIYNWRAKSFPVWFSFCWFQLHWIHLLCSLSLSVKVTPSWILSIQPKTKFVQFLNFLAEVNLTAYFMTFIADYTIFNWKSRSLTNTEGEGHSLLSTIHPTEESYSSGTAGSTIDHLHPPEKSQTCLWATL